VLAPTDGQDLLDYLHRGVLRLRPNGGCGC